MRQRSTADAGQPDRRRVQSIGTLVSQLISRRGYAEAASGDQFRQQIEAVVGTELAASVRVGKLNRGVLKLFATDSVTLQELTFQKRAILRRIQQEMPQAQVSDLRFAVLQS